MELFLLLVLLYKTDIPCIEKKEERFKTDYVLITSSLTTVLAVRFLKQITKGSLTKSSHKRYPHKFLVVWRFHLIIYKPFVLFIRPAGRDVHCSRSCDFFIKFVRRRTAPFPESCQPSIFRGRLPIRPEKSDQVTSGYIVAISRHTEKLVYVRDGCCSTR